MDYLLLITSIITAYLLGSIPTGFILTKLVGFGDIRKIGSGNIGATNVLRTGNRLLAVITLAADVLKGALSVWIGNIFAEGVVISGFKIGHITGLAALAGHLYPIWLSFKGGKGVATSIGVFSGILWPAGIVFCCSWIVTAIIFRYSSLSALVALVVIQLFCIFWGDIATLILFFAISLLLLKKHRENICRLLNGREPKISLQRQC